MRTIFPIAIAVLGLASCDLRESRRSAFVVEHCLKTAIGSELPHIRDLEGMGDTWEGFNCFFRFNYTNPDIRSILLNKGFEKADFTSTEYRFNLPVTMQKHFTPAWKPRLHEDSDILIKEFRDGSSTVILLDASNHQAHVQSNGDNSPK